MSTLKLKSLWFFVDEDERIHKVPVAKYNRIFDRTQPIALFAGQSIRFINARIEVDDAGEEHLWSPACTRHKFDEQGLWDEQDKEKHLEGALEMVSVSLSGGDPDWEAFYKTEHPDPYHWKPTPELMVRLKEAIRTNKNHS
jgi:hypothetical protein